MSWFKRHIGWTSTFLFVIVSVIWYLIAGANSFLGIMYMGYIWVFFLIGWSIKTGWFKRHLNWALIIALIVFGSVIVAGDELVGEGDRLAGLVMMWVGIPLCLASYAWVIKQKGRSLWCLLYILLNPVFGLGTIIVLCLENRASERVAQEEA